MAYRDNLPQRDHSRPPSQKLQMNLLTAAQHPL